MSWHPVQPVQMLTPVCHYAATLRWNFNTPIARELMLLHGFVDADAATLRKVLLSSYL